MQQFRYRYPVVREITQQELRVCGQNRSYPPDGYGRIYFLSRSRRFGKSLLVSTLEALFQGRKELFEGLYIYDKWNWSQQYPVITIDWTGINHSTSEITMNSDSWLMIN
jgi:hypothetical protein